MADDKDSAEGKLMRYLRSRLGAEFDDIMAALGGPRDLNKIPVEFWNEQTAQTLAGIRPILEASALRAAEALSITVPVLWDPTVLAREAIDWAGQYSYDLVRKIDENTLSVLRRIIPQFAETPGMTIGDLRKRLGPVFGEVRAQSIAVTETTRAFAEGQRLVQKELALGGVNRVRKWNTSGDEVVCDICGPLDGKTEDEWGGIASPPAHPRCRCWTTLVREK